MYNFVADPGELTTLRGVLDEYCASHNVFESRDRDECARRILALFSAGITSREHLLARMGGAVRGSSQNAA